MSKYTIHIGTQEFSSKSKALKYYKNILNSYTPNQTLNQKDFQSVKRLVYKDFDDDLINEYEQETNMRGQPSILNFLVLK